MSGKRNPRRGASPGGSTGAPGVSAALRWYGAGVASGLFAAFMIYLASLPPEQGDAPTAAAPDTTAPLPQPSFEFYELLPQSEPPPQTEPGIAPGTAATAPPRTLYLLQAGAFRDPGDADRRRAELLLLGLEPAIEETQSKGERWYRVLLGPFDSRSAMARARSLTAQQDIDTLLMRRQPEGA